jgi:hypothetical protein
MCLIQRSTSFFTPSKYKFLLLALGFIARILSFTLSRFRYNNISVYSVVSNTFIGLLNITCSQ